MISSISRLVCSSNASREFAALVASCFREERRDSREDISDWRRDSVSLAWFCREVTWVRVWRMVWRRMSWVPSSWSERLSTSSLWRAASVACVCVCVSACGFGVEIVV